jgi:hypothetical protein
MKRLVWIAAILLPLSSCKTASRAAPEAWLWSQQAGDGGWHSETYGLLRSGQSLTPFVLLTLLESGAAPAANVDRALAFIATHTAADGSLGRVDESSQDYPNYATSLAIRAIVKARRAGWDRQIEPMVRYLRSQQFTEANGWKPSDAPYGGWGMGAGEPLRPPHTGHVDLSMTRHVLEALRDAGVPSGDAAVQKASVYLGRLQNRDGGFIFSTTEEDTNKAGSSPEGFRSYGTATADGILALRAAGAAVDDPRVQRAWQWLASRQRDPRRIAGFEGEAYARWHLGLAYYYGAALADVSRAMSEPSPPWTLPDPDVSGRSVNPENLVKEDDPLIATAFRIRALKP